MLVTHAGTHMHIQTRNMHVVAVSGLRLGHAKACDIDRALFYLTTIAYLFDFSTLTPPLWPSAHLFCITQRYSTVV